METRKITGLIDIFIPLLIIVFIIAVGVVMLYLHFQKNLYMRLLQEETLRRDHQRELLRANIEAQEEERKRIAQDLHDELGAVLSITRMNIMMLERECGNLFPGLLPGLLQVRSLSESALANMRSISHRLMPPQLEMFGLVKTLDSVVAQISITGKLDVALSTREVPNDMPLGVSLGLYRAIMELLNNTIKHAAATRAIVDIEHAENTVICRYSDNGKGISEHSGFGLGHKSIDGRISALNGTFTFGSQQDSGFWAVISVPLLPV